MSEKSYVTLEQKICPICGASHDTGSLLFDRHLRERFNHKTVTGLDLCPEHQKLHADGFLALVAVNNTSHEKTLKPAEANRTGEIVHMKYEVAKEMFNIPISENMPFVYVDPKVVEMIKDRYQKDTGQKLEA